MAIVVVSQYFPFVLMDMGPGDRSEADFTQMFADLHEQNLRAMREGTRYALVAFTRKNLSAAERKLVAENSNKVPIAERANTLVSVCILTNPFVRGALTALTWLIPGLLPTLVPAADAESAIQIASSHLRRSAIPFKIRDMELAEQWLRERVEAPATADRAAP
jgi:hypothetical protein